MSERLVIVIDATHESQRLVGPPPPPELGRDLCTVSDVRRWLEHPSNWHTSQLFHLRPHPWRAGVPPTISRHMAERLRQFPEEADEFYRLVLQKVLSRVDEQEPEEEHADLSL